MTKFLPEWVAPDGEITRPTASEINELAPQQQTVTVAGYNEPVPFVYGLQQVGGPIIAGPVSLLSNRSLVFAVALCRSGARRIESVDAVMINGVDQGAMPDINVNPTIVSKSSINFRIYNGTQIREDDTLKAALGAGFEDYFPETAYAVITVPVAQANDFNIASSIIWTIKGRRCLDPRTSAYAWTENPSLHLSDFVTCKKYGLDREIIGVEECANWNDSLYNGLPRARTGLVLNEALEEHQVLDLMSTYAECLWSYEGRAIRIIADAPVESPVAIIAKDQIREGTVTISGANQANFPTALSIIFSDRSRPEEWGSIPAHVQSTDHDVYGSIGSQSDLSLLGVYRRVEADRRAWSRFMRLQVPGKISFQMFDDGISFQTGDVIQLPDYMGLRGVVVRIISRPEPVDVGLYQTHGEIYRVDFYPDGKDGTVIPDNALILMSSSSKPDDYSLHYEGEDLPILGSAVNGVKAELNPPTGSMSISLSPAGSHKEPTDTVTSNWQLVDPLGRIFRGYILGYFDGSSMHSHSASVNLTNRFKGVFKKERRVLRLLKREPLSVSSSYPPTGMVFLSAKPLSGEGFETLDIAGMILKVGNESRSLGQDPGPKNTWSTSDGDHGHHPNESYYDPIRPRDDMGDPISSITMFKKSGTHGHEVFGCEVIHQRLKSKSIFAYRVVSDNTLLPKGAIIGIDGAEPEGWALCDGMEGRENLNDFFLSGAVSQSPIETLDSVNEIKISGLSGSGVSGAHRHETTTHSGRWHLSKTVMGAHSANANSHRHATTTSPDMTFNYRPKSFGIKFIQYTGA